MKTRLSLVSAFLCLAALPVAAQDAPASKPFRLSLSLVSQPSYYNTGAIGGSVQAQLGSNALEANFITDGNRLHGGGLAFKHYFNAPQRRVTPFAFLQSQSSRIVYGLEGERYTMTGLYAGLGIEASPLPWLSVTGKLGAGPAFWHFRSSMLPDNWGSLAYNGFGELSLNFHLPFRKGNPVHQSPSPDDLNSQDQGRFFVELRHNVTTRMSTYPVMDATNLRAGLYVSPRSYVFAEGGVLTPSPYFSSVFYPANDGRGWSAAAGWGYTWYNRGRFSLMSELSAGFLQERSMYETFVAVPTHFLTVGYAHKARYTLRSGWYGEAGLANTVRFALPAPQQARDGMSLSLGIGKRF